MIAQFSHGVTVPPLDTVQPYTKYGVSPNVRKYPYDPEQARALLAEAGWDPNRKILWMVSEVTPSNEPIFAALNGYWAEVGVQTEFFRYLSGTPRPIAVAVQKEQYLELTHRVDVAVDELRHSRRDAAAAQSSAPCRSPT